MRYLSILLILAACLPVAARRHTPYERSRIYWDVTSKQQLFNGGNYSRLIQLRDGRLLVVAEAGGGISVSFSDDNGSTWTGSRLIAANAPGVPYAVPDVIQLANGDIVVGFNPRPSAPYSDDRRFGIRCVRSTDGGVTWTAPIFIYDAQATYTEGCWEPCFLELPSGELQCYFANENNFPYSGEQEISMSRSFDGGVTWSDAVRICFSSGSRDGMPVPLLTEHNEIVVIIEDNGWPGYGGFRATTVRTTLEDNWADWVRREGGRRQMIFANNNDKGYISAAPYIRKLGLEETITSWQGDRGDRHNMGEDHFDMYVGVGDADGRNVTAISAPFSLPVSKHGLWNSVSALDDGTVFALSSIGNAGQGNSIYMMRGFAAKGFEATSGTPVIDGTVTDDAWDDVESRPLLLGSQILKYPASFRFMYDDDNLYVTAAVEDHTLNSQSDGPDGVTVAFDIENCCDAYPQNGMYRFFINPNGDVTFHIGNGNAWRESEVPSSVVSAAHTLRNSYTIEVAIPWSVLGCETAPVERLMRCYADVHDNRSGTVLTETITDAVLESSWTWPEFTLRKTAGSDGVGDTLRDSPAEISILRSDSSLKITSTGEMAAVALYDVSGLEVAHRIIQDNETVINTSGLKGVYITCITYSNGMKMHRKVIL